MSRTLIKLLTFLSAAAGGVIAAEPAVDSTPVPNSGTVLLHGGGRISAETLDTFLTRAGNHGRVILIATSAEKSVRDAQLAAWSKRGLLELVQLVGSSRAEAETSAFDKALETATGVWICAGGDPAELEKIYSGTETVRLLEGVLGRGGAIGGSAAELIGAFGSKLLPGVVAVGNYEEGAQRERLKASVAATPGSFGYGIEKDTALAVIGRTNTISGDGSAHAYLAASANGKRPAARLVLRVGSRWDHIAFCRAALARLSDDFPPASFPSPELESGTIVLIGGGRPPRRGFEAFVEAAGGRAARIVAINTALGSPPPKTAADLSGFDSVGATNVRLLHAADRAEAASEAFIAELDRAGGVWFTGGRQWLLVDRYAGTPVIEALHRVLARGGAVGGTSAGATICGDYLVRGDPRGRHIMMAEGYERGFALLPGLAIDQHFTRRNRLPDLVELKRCYPQLLAIGIDESTAAIIGGSRLRTVGLGRITVLDRPLPSTNLVRPDQHFTVLERDDIFDLKDLKILSKEPIPAR